MDFSEAERSGFISAFIEFWTFELTVGLMKNLQPQWGACCMAVRNIFEQALHVLRALMVSD